jgi:GDP-L-fucose synthase
MILITGASGMLGKAVARYIVSSGALDPSQLLLPNRIILNLEDSQSCFKYFQTYKPEIVIHLAAKVMGLQGNLELQADSLLVNSAINSNLFQAMAKYPPKKVFFAGTAASYSYPYKQIPLREEDFLSGDVHDGEFGYAWSKRIAYPWLRILRDEFGTKSIYGILTNLFGPNDRFIGSHTHVIPALIRRAHNTNLMGSTELDVWGFPTTTRDFLCATEAARLIVTLILSATIDPKNLFINIGSGVETSMSAVAEVISREFEIKRMTWLHEKPVGVQRRYLDISKLVEFDIQVDSNFEKDLVSTINWYKANFEVVR